MNGWVFKWVRCLIAAVGLLAAPVHAQPARDAAAARSGKGAVEIEHRTLETSRGAHIEADAGRLMAPENRAVSGSRRIPIRFLRLRSTSASPRAPLFYLAGGPGDRGISESKGALQFWSQF